MFASRRRRHRALRNGRRPAALYNESSICNADGKKDGEKKTYPVDVNLSRDGTCLLLFHSGRKRHARARKDGRDGNDGHINNLYNRRTTTITLPIAMFPLPPLPQLLSVARQCSLVARRRRVVAAAAAAVAAAAPGTPWNYNCSASHR